MAVQAARLFDIENDLHLVPQLAQIHHDCITNDYTMVTFLPPLQMSKILAFWHNYTNETRHDGRDIFIQIKRHDDHEEVMGVVSLEMPRSETGPFRCNVQKLLVSPNHRKQGVARALMLKLEEVAKQKDRWLVVSLQGISG